MKIITFLTMFFGLTTIGLAQTNCSSALALTPGIQQCGNSTGNSGDFPSDGSAPTNPCSPNHNDDEYWFTYTPDAEVDVVELTLSSISTFFTGIYVLDNCPSSAPSCIAGTENLASTADLNVSFSVTSGSTYKIVIVTFGPPDGSAFCLDAVETLCLAPIASVPTEPINNANCPATVDFTISIDDMTDSNSLTISTDDGTGSQAGVGGTVNSEGNFIITNIPVPQTNWTIKIAHESNSSCDIELGPFVLDCPPINNNLCNATAIVVNANEIQGSNAFSDSENMEAEGSCWVNGGDLNSVWYSFVAPNSESVEVSTDYANSSLSDSRIAVYGASDCSDLSSLTEIACDEDSGNNGNTASVEVFQLTAGETYYVQVDGKQNTTGEFEISVKEITPDNDDCANSKVIPGNLGFPILLDEFFSGATASGFGTEVCDNNSTPSPGDLWYVIGSASGNVSVQVEPGANSDIVLSIYSGCFTQLFQFCADLGGNGVAENINFNNPGGAVYIRVYEKSESGESFDITAVIPALPIILSDFKVSAQRRGNLVQWSTLSEINSDYIEVQSSPNGTTQWGNIGKIVTKGESSSKIDYELFDYNPYEVTYYRLNAVDKDGKTELSKVIHVKRTDNLDKMSLSPNPTSSNISLQTVSSTVEAGIVRVLDLNGEVMKNESISLSKGLNTISIQLDDLSAGIYLISLETVNGIQVEKIVKY